ncbi:hypothetical protein VPHD164_0030 [Vibrio phage D164]
MIKVIFIYTEKHYERLNVCINSSIFDSTCCNECDTVRNQLTEKEDENE